MRGQHESSDMDPKYVLYFAVALVIFAAAVYGGLWWMFHRFEAEQAQREGPPPLVDVPEARPQPHLQISPQGDLEELHRQENEILTSYGWIDREKAIARIPIDRAMQVFLERQKK
jgi:hypothetical protein